MLNDKQREFAEKNHNLIYSFMTRFKIPEEAYDILAIAYCHAVSAYRPECGSFSTYAFKAMQNELKRENRKQFTQNRIPKHLMVSLNEQLGDESSGTLEDILETKDSLYFEDQVINNLYIKEYLSRVSKKERKALILYLSGVTYREIGRIIGFSRTRAGQIIEKFRKHYREDTFPKTSGRGIRKIKD